MSNNNGNNPNNANGKATVDNNPEQSLRGQITSGVLRRQWEQLNEQDEEEAALSALRFRALLLQRHLIGVSSTSTYQDRNLLQILDEALRLSQEVGTTTISYSSSGRGSSTNSSSNSNSERDSAEQPLRTPPPRQEDPRRRFHQQDGSSSSSSSAAKEQ